MRKLLLGNSLAAAFVLASSLVAQTGHTHVELTVPSAGMQGPPGAQWVVVSNDSDKKIVAFRVMAECGRTKTLMSEDAFQMPLGLPRHPYDGKPRHLGVIEPGEDNLTTALLTPQPSGCEWQAHVVSVVYADGTWEGTEDAIQQTKAYREGVLDAVYFWAKKTSRNGDADKWLEQATQEQASRVENDRAKAISVCRMKQDIACAYWTGRTSTDGVAGMDTRSHDSAAGIRRGMHLHFQSLLDYMQKDRALQAMERTLPPSSEVPPPEK